MARVTLFFLSLIYFAYLTESIRTVADNQAIIKPTDAITNLPEDESTLNTAEDLVPRKVKLPLGNVIGSACPTDRTVTRYLGIPFAEPILGENRFTPPRIYETPYPEGGLQATSIPAPCGSLCNDKTKDNSASSENCLFLNIWVPARAALGKLTVPVRVYIHGGDLTECSASDDQWSGCQSASKVEMIQVNIQWRLGAFGMFAHPITMSESNTTGNWGLMDQQLALTWVKEHIAAFGGDPNKVLLNGHSRGAQMVDFHMVAPGSRDLFSAAISQSPPCVHFRTLEQAYEDSKKFMATVECSPLPTMEEELACMRALPWAYVMNTTRIMEAGRALNILWCDRVDWSPTFHHAIDGTVIPQQMIEALEAGHYQRVPYMVGFTTDEAGAFVGPFYTTDVNPSTIDEFIKQTFPGADPKPIMDLYDYKYFKDAPYPILAQYSAIWSDVFFTCPTHQRLVARSRVDIADTYLYWWGAGPSCPPEYQYFGPIHGVDLWFTFGEVTNFTSSVTPTGYCDFLPNEVDLSNKVLTAYQQLAETGVPRWPNKTAWVTWDPVNELGTYLNSGIYETKRLSFVERCDALEKAKQLEVIPLDFQDPKPSRQE